MIDYDELFPTPDKEENIALLKWIEKRIAFHEGVAEECTCHDPDAGCWYHISEKEQWALRFDSLFYALTQEAADGFPTFIKPPDQ